MKKIVSLILVLILSVTVLAGCGGKKNDGKVHIKLQFNRGFDGRTIQGEKY